MLQEDENTSGCAVIGKQSTSIYSSAKVYIKKKKKKCRSLWQKYQRSRSPFSPLTKRDRGYKLLHTTALLKIFSLTSSLHTESGILLYFTIFLCLWIINSVHSVFNMQIYNVWVFVRFIQGHKTIVTSSWGSDWVGYWGIWPIRCSHL